MAKLFLSEISGMVQPWDFGRVCVDGGSPLPPLGEVCRRVCVCVCARVRVSGRVSVRA